ncbi:MULTISPECIES: ABC transporter ATP-binding protein [Sphingobacterium]|uniref:ABC-2 type transport system ATP-binding protein n=2 Tax=Sphingobacterium TaxID=28453 RepID=A0A562MK54_9SPHI|nr:MULTISPECIES: ABC transporter ATP-binding protein [Sphingobacterium]TWI20256.1 ABC-2 type transport system ATP-binding protein [Sphingobacterium siyangense]UQA74755.1 ABC transporter ATP-binding protein [Sphingobacterium siyangense]HAT93628.1 ABC transporter ATP-binding protein [Sphingobacterium sp.]
MESILPLIRIVDLKKSYGVKEILKGINLDIFPGQVIGYIGPNGAGKSTTVKILTGLIEDFTGTVEVNGINIQEDPLAVKALLGYVPENAELYDVLTPMEYLDFIGKLYGMEDNLILERSLKLLTAFGLESNANNRMDTFSKGMRQKVLLISGIIHNPQIIVLDEPLSGLDANAVIFVKELISLLAKEGKTIFYCSHMMDVVEKVSDRILLINQGSIIADGTIEELKTDPNESLEHIFAKLTNTGNSALDASNIITAIQ